MSGKSREWLCILTLKGHDARGGAVTIGGRGTYTAKPKGTMDGLLEHVIQDLMTKQKTIVDVPVVVFWSATPNDLDSA